MVVALLLATFVAISVADMFLCASESVDAHYVMADSHDESVDSQSNGSDSDSGHDACSHGHCHHIYAHIPRARPPKPSPSIRRISGQPVMPLRLALLTG